MSKAFVAVCTQAPTLSPDGTTRAMGRATETTAAAVVALALLSSSPDRTRLGLLVIVSAIVVAGIVALAVRRTADPFTQLDGYVAAFWFALPALAAWSLTLPSAVRGSFRPLTSSRPQQPTQAWG